MGHHRAELIQRLDQVLERLDLGFGYLNQHNPYLEEHDLTAMQVQYAALRTILFEVDEEMRTLTGTYPRLSTHFCRLILADMPRAPHNLYVCAAYMLVIG